MKRRVLHALSVFALAALFMVPAEGIFASGYENIGGEAESTVIFYYTVRYVTTPSSPGPEVAFLQYSGPAGLALGTHNCNGDVEPLRPQSIGSWEPVGYFLNPALYCLYSYSNSGAGGFSGMLNWD